MKRLALAIGILFLSLLLAACGPSPTPAPLPPILTPLPTDTTTPTSLVTAVPTDPPPTGTAVPTPVPATLPPAAKPTALPPTAVPTMAPIVVDTSTRAQDGMVMVHVPAGEFPMGSAPRGAGAFPNEKPQHTVYLDAFWIDRTEVTVALFRAFVEASGYVTTAEKKGSAYAWVESAKEWQQVSGADWQHPFGPGSNAEDSHPVVQVTWSDAAAYCAWVGGSLPTEAQWEKTARGTDGRTYPWGSTFDGTRLNYCDSRCTGGDPTFDDGYRFTAPVGSYPSGISPYGALDMAGNAWEWTADRYDEGYYAQSPARNPGGPPAGYSRVLRGGSWNHDRSGMRTAFRLDSPLANSVDNFGFRCTVPAGSEP